MTNNEHIDKFWYKPFDLFIEAIKNFNNKYGRLPEKLVMNEDSYQYLLRLNAADTLEAFRHDQIWGINIEIDANQEIPTFKDSKFNEEPV